MTTQDLVDQQADHLWVSNTGRVACWNHGGGYLLDAVKRDPQATGHATPLDAWTRLPRAMVDLPCEECGR